MSALPFVASSQVQSTSSFDPRYILNCHILAAVPIQAAGQPGQPIMHSREPDVSIWPIYSLSGERPFDLRVVVELEVHLVVFSCFMMLDIVNRPSTDRHGR